MVTQIHCILDNIDSVLDKIEAQTNSAARRPPAFNENHSVASLTEQAQQTIDQITQTAASMVERHRHTNDGSGDTTSLLIDLAEESHSDMSSVHSDDTIDSFH